MVSNLTSPLRYFYCVLTIATVNGCTEHSATPPVPALTSTVQADATATEVANSIVSTDRPNGNDAVPGERPAAGPHVVRKEATDAVPAEMPGVWLSTEHSSLCRVRVGDKFPDITLPKVSGEETEVSDFLGKQATVVLFWQPDRWMAKTALSDLARDVVAKYDSDQVSVLGIAINQAAEDVEQRIEESKADFLQLLDADGKAFNKLGMVALPRVYVLNSTGTIMWFDIEYSESTRRELGDAISVLTAGDK